MKNHFIGLLIFSFIISASAMVAFWLAPLPQIAPVETFEKTAPRFEGYGGCKRKRRKPRDAGNASVKILQANLSEFTHKLTTNFDIRRADGETETVGINLNFYIKDGSQTKFLKRETVWLSPAFGSNDEATHQLLSSFEWLNRIGDKENLYIIPEIVNGFESNQIPTEFDANQATAVTIEKYAYKYVAR